MAFSAKRAMLFSTILVGAFLAFDLSAAPAENVADTAGPDKILKIGTKISPPMAMKSKDGTWEGISIELWKKIAAELHVRYEFVEMPLTDLLKSVQTSSIDAAVGSLSVTSEREKTLDFSQPFFHTGLSIAVRHDQALPLFDVMEAVFSWRFVEAIGALLLALLIAGTGVWLFENRRNPEQFGGHFIKGIGAGFWLSAVTMSSVGYGDKAPKTLGGRVIVLIWMFTSIIIISSLTAAITSALTVERLSTSIRQPSDLVRMRSTTVAGSTSASWLEGHGYSVTTFPTLRDALSAIDSGKYDAVVYDEPLLRYSVLTEFPGLHVLPLVFCRQNYGIAFPSNSPLREQVNLVLLKILQTDDWDSLVKKHLGSEASS